MEMLYHVDEEDNVIGPVSRNYAHQNMILHRSGMVFLFNPVGKVFITDRSNKKLTFPNCKDSSSSFHVPYGESYEAAATRELGEETGVVIELRYLGKFIHRDPPEYQIVAVFRGYWNGDIKLDLNEASCGEWMEKNKIDEIISGSNTTPWLRDGWKLLRNL